MLETFFKRFKLCT